MARADYEYEKLEVGGRKFIAIKDLDLGGMSVTNCIEDVVDEICQLESIEPANRLWIYRDSEGIWDGWNPEQECFVILTKETAEDAVRKYLQVRHLHSTTQP